MITPNFSGIITQGKPKLDDPESFILWCRQFENKRIDITVKKHRRKRTKDQNRFYWMYLNLIEKETGNLADDIHEIAKRKFLIPIFKEVLGKKYKIPNSTTNLNKFEFSEYLDKICAWSEVPIPSI